MPDIKEKLSNIPHAPGVYLMRDAAARIIYIGKAGDLRKRISSYFRDDTSYKTGLLMSMMRHVDFVLASSEREALVLENRLIKKYKPYYNVMLKDDKTYPYLKLTSKEDFPQIFFTRKVVKDGSEYFGPYPHMSETKKLFRWMRRVFQWRYCKLKFGYDSLPEHKKIKSCLYLHTGHCPAPCTGSITPKEYKKNLVSLKLFLKGRHKKLAEMWEKEMKTASRNMKFERASVLRDRIRALRITNERVTIRELKPYDLTKSLKITDTLEELKDRLKLERWPIIIEGFDISHLAGTSPVASMVRFENAKPDKDNYRKFKIKLVKGINDTAMIAEVVFRRYYRLKKEKSRLPDLILIDGGKGQLNAACKSLDELKLNIPVVSLAKREEDVYIPGTAEPVKIPKDSKALLLLKAVRDESHRFALSFQKSKRS